MKIRKFYPRQVLRKLQGEHKALEAAQLAAITYCARKGRKLGISLMIDSTATASELLAAGSPELAHAVIANATTRIILREAA